ncbi:molybdenum cofactor guanylyltransferase [candidate division NPL-UPA2 bacterium Unc8]|uniref:Molybdenum cofactor guanylyltransferase n=1 Tax=candidate division NPL-UPA2 bacterium Unc8 TaxID=1980939 RepID=A0A399FYL6_UNCN2|nr:Molybdenum cofactor guanylyltransferase [Bacillota bacterium]MBT9146458.1 Molybdenum cofactor guanylyltransferase [Bacillota bacterium]RII00546.1 MAG: molybdenum cofactor guanylyltransferase [candidate division NPL-UPA2 bacterium Unc8]
MGNKAGYFLNESQLSREVWRSLSSLSDDFFFQLSQSIVADFPVKMDVVAEKGPLGGIYSALSHARYNQVFILACDMPFFDIRLLEELQKFSAYDIAVPQWQNGYYEPLSALYSKSITNEIEKMFEQDITKISQLYNRVSHLAELNIDELIRSSAISSNCFTNINSCAPLKTSL